MKIDFSFTDHSLAQFIFKTAEISSMFGSNNYVRLLVVVKCAVFMLIGGYDKTDRSHSLSKL